MVGDGSRSVVLCGVGGAVTKVKQLQIRSTKEECAMLVSVISHDFSLRRQRIFEPESCAIRNVRRHWVGNVRYPL